MWLLLILIAIITLLTYYTKTRTFKYWEKRGFPTLPNRNCIFGNTTLPVLGRKSFSDFYRDAYFHFKKNGHKIGGAYIMNLPLLIATDNELAKKILHIDFEAFADRGIEYDEKTNPLAAHLVNLDGDMWQSLRKKLSPTFTSGKMKQMFPIMERHIDLLMDKTKTICNDGKADIMYAEWLDRAGVDIISHIAFGLDSNTVNNEDDYLFALSRRILRPPKWKAMKMLMFGLTNPANIITLLTCDSELTDFFINTFKETVEYRRKNNVKADDFLQSLMELLDDKENGITMLEAAAEAFVFFAGGFETTSRTINFILYELAQRPKLQEELREEIKKELRDNKGFSYDWIMNNETLDCVVKESLRKYPPITTLNRTATRDYEIKELGLTIPARTCIVLPLLGFHYDADYFEEPEEFKPERFKKENAHKIKGCTNLAFGEGPRFCIGKRFGYMQSKLTLAKLLINYEIIKSDLTDYPVKLSPLTSSLLLMTKNPVYFKLKPL